MTKHNGGNNHEDHSAGSQILSETDNMAVWRSLEETGYIYHLEIGNLSLHFVPEEWDELIILIKEASTN